MVAQNRIIGLLSRAPLLAMLLLAVASGAGQAAEKVKDIRLGVSDARTRVVLDLGARVDFDVFLLDNPRRVVVDLPSLDWPSKTPKADGLVGGIRDFLN